MVGEERLIQIQWWRASGHCTLTPDPGFLKNEGKNKTQKKHTPIERPTKK